MKTVKELFGLEGKNILLTGGAGHLGSCLAKAYLEMGARVILFDKDPERLCAVQAELGAGLEFFAVDLSKEEEMLAAIQEVEKRVGHLDVLLNNAAFVGTSSLTGWAVKFESQSIETWRSAMEVNLTSACFISQACLPMLRKSGDGSIINISSIYGLVGPDWSLYEGTVLGNPAAYAASKGGLLQLTRWLATTLAPEIRVNAISPGGIWRNQPESFHDKYKDRTPLKRMAKEEDLIGAVIYLSSHASSYVTGHNLVVDGGWTAW